MRGKLCKHCHQIGIVVMYEVMKIISSLFLNPVSALFLRMSVQWFLFPLDQVHLKAKFGSS